MFTWSPGDRRSVKRCKSSRRATPWQPAPEERCEVRKKNPCEKTSTCCCEKQDEKKKKKTRHLLELIGAEALQVDGIVDGVEERSRLQGKVFFCQRLHSAAQKAALLRRLKQKNPPASSRWLRIHQSANEKRNTHHASRIFSCNAMKKKTGTRDRLPAPFNSTMTSGAMSRGVFLNDDRVDVVMRRDAPLRFDRPPARR